MRFVDKKFKNNKKQYILQCLLATAALVLILISVDFVLHTAIVASLGATSFIVFTMPHKNRGKARYILGGYMFSVITGGICSIFINLNPNITPGILGAIAVGLCMFLMVVFNAEHPPAAALALGIVIEGFDIKTIIFVFFVSCLLLFVKYLNRRWIIDLV
ncbi:MAG: HPP family protein [Vallitaleaceae bacterium]|jgi:CBS-domain-containing membrane protein|nr:HPP family protein [Vallitaleaceae bacterium]